ncbi:hypothetical protein Ancab_039217, partial [Ancistrocladus abbreviatus]
VVAAPIATVYGSSGGLSGGSGSSLCSNSTNSSEYGGGSLNGILIMEDFTSLLSSRAMEIEIPQISIWSITIKVKSHFQRLTLP